MSSGEPVAWYSSNSLVAGNTTLGFASVALNIDVSASESSDDCRSEPDALALEAGELNRHGMMGTSLVRDPSTFRSPEFMDDRRDRGCPISLCEAWKEVKARSCNLWRTG